jgi:regulator of replication initiation timing
MPEAVAEAQRIISEYAQKCSTVDEGNLYFAATQLENAYSALTKQVAALKAECERLKNELDEMTLRFQALQSGFEIKKLKSENAALVAENLKLERALAIESSEPRDRSQEAAHYNWLDDQNAALTLENTDFRAALVEIGIGEVDYGNGQMGNMGIDEAMAIARAVLSKHAKKESK